MPIYEYRCPNGHLFELFQRMDEAPPSVCETCGEGPVERVLYPVAVHFKGSGFYSTDYGRGGRKRDSSDSDGAAKKGESKDVKKIEKSDKSDKKPAAKEN